NEMGAAWVVENDHIALFTPGFDPSNPKFWEGAVEPRELGVFIENKEDIIEFAEMVINKLDSKVNAVIFDQVITKYMSAIEEIKYNQENNEPEQNMDSDYEKQKNKKAIDKTNF